MQLFPPYAEALRLTQTDWLPACTVISGGSGYSLWTSAYSARHFSSCSESVTFVVPKNACWYSAWLPQIHWCSYEQSSSATTTAPSLRAVEFSTVVGTFTTVSAPPGAGNLGPGAVAPRSPPGNRGNGRPGPPSAGKPPGPRPAARPGPASASASAASAASTAPASTGGVAGIRRSGAYAPGPGAA